MAVLKAIFVENRPGRIGGFEGLSDFWNCFCKYAPYEHGTNDQPQQNFPHHTIDRPWQTTNLIPCFNEIMIETVIARQTMDMKEFLKNAYKKNGKKAVAIFLVYFVTKWTLTIIFGAKIVAAFKGWVN